MRGGRTREDEGGDGRWRDAGTGHAGEHERQAQTAQGGDEHPRILPESPGATHQPPGGAARRTGLRFASMDHQPTPHWLDSPLGATLLETETAAVAEALSKVFGFNLLQVGLWGAPAQFTPHARTRHASVVGAELSNAVGARCRPSRLAVASDSIDAVLLPHTLELDPEPHRVLREVSRVLVGEGHLVVLGFNPWSAWGLRRLLARGSFPRGARQLIPERRLRDWLSLLGLEVCAASRCLHVPPVNRDGLLRRLARFESRAPAYLDVLAGVYVLVAQKRVYSVTPLRPQWSRKPRRVAAGLVEPTTRSAA